MNTGDIFPGAMIKAFGPGVIVYDAASGQALTVTHGVVVAWGKKKFLGDILIIAALTLTGTAMVSLEIQQVKREWRLLTDGELA